MEDKVNISSPMIRYIGKDIEKGIMKLEKELQNPGLAEEKQLILDYPTVYIHNSTKAGKYEVYIGETYNIVNRTLQHIEASKDKTKWQNMLNSKTAGMYIIGHEHFNKSLTLDIENRLMLYLFSVDAVSKVYNRRGNPQNKYYTSQEFEEIFEKIWDELNKRNRELFPNTRSIISSAIYKASPLHKLTEEQERIKNKIIVRVKKAVKQEKAGKIIFVSGEAGTGKTVLNSNLFYELCMMNREENAEKLNCYLLVNHDQQLTVYQRIAQKLGLQDKKKEVVCKPTKFITNHSENNLADVVFVDEAHLLWTQGKQAYQGKNQLFDIQKRAKVVIVMFDKSQILRREQYWEHQLIEDLERQAKKNDNYLELKEQLRIKAGKETLEWIYSFTKEQRINKIPEDKDYEIEIFDTPKQLQDAIVEKEEKENIKLCRLIATFDWDFKKAKSRRARMEKCWEIIIGEWRMPWNLQLPDEKEERRKNKNLAWAEQSHTINEVGSTYTIQGFDLNYAGVILGPSVKYRNGKIVFDPKCSKNHSAIQARTLSNGKKEKFGETLLKNEVNVLMTRGVEGLFIYAEDEALRQALQKAKRK